MKKHYIEYNTEFVRNPVLFITVAVLLNMIACSPDAESNRPVIRFRNPQALVESVMSAVVIMPRFSQDGQNIIFSGRLDGDLWDCIYTVPVAGGKYRKLHESTENLLFPAYSYDGTKIVFSRGLTRQVVLKDLQTDQVTPLPVFGNCPLLLPDGETVLYSGVIDGNLKLFHVATSREKNLTESFVSVNYSPELLLDQRTLCWVENIRNRWLRLNRVLLDSLRRVQYVQLTNPIISMTASPSGNWTILGRAGGALSGFNPRDSSYADVRLEGASQSESDPVIALNPHWSPIGRQVVYCRPGLPSGSGRSPFRKEGHFIADIAIAQLGWSGIRDEEILRTPSAEPVTIFPPQSEAEPIPARQPERDTNNPPRIYSRPVGTVYADELYIYRIQAVEIDLFDDLIYRLATGPSNSELLPKSGILLWIPPDTGTYDFGVSASDQNGGSDQQFFKVKVLPKPDWRPLKAKSAPPALLRDNFIGGMKFIDPDDDGYLTVGEEAQIQIDLRCRSFAVDSVRLQLISGTLAGEIEWNPELVFERCEQERWSRQRVTIRALQNIRNRPLIIRGILESKQGIQLLPAVLTIAVRNENLPTL